MYRVLIADDDYEDRELLKLEIERTLSPLVENIRCLEAVSVSKALELLKSQPFDLLTLDIEFDRMTEGVDALPEIFESYPTLNIIVISGKLNKSEVSERLFKFTKDNILKSKRWARHFDVLDKKDDKTEALERAFEFSLKQQETADNLRDMFLLAESYLEKDDIEKCIEVYQKIQGLAPEDHESRENIGAIKGAAFEQALEYQRKGEKVVASLLLGHHIESRLKMFTKKLLGRSHPGLYDCLKELEKSKRISPYKKTLFQHALRLRNKAVHHPGTTTEADFQAASDNLKLIEAAF